MVHDGGTRLQRNILPAGIDKIQILLAARCYRPIADNTVLGMIGDVAIADVSVRAHGRNADAEIDDPAVLEFKRDSIRHLLARESLGGSAHRRRSWRRVGHNPSGGGGTFTTRCTKMPDACT